MSYFPNNPTTERRIYAVIDCDDPGVVRGYSEALRRTKNGGYTKRCRSVHEASRYCLEVTGEHPPSVLGKRPGEHTPPGSPNRDLPRVRVKTEDGVIEKVLRGDEEIAGLKALGLYP